MDYHKERFEDYSLLVYKEDELIGLLPANIKDKTIYSHQGLSYGTFLLTKDTKFSTVLKSIEKLLEFLAEEGIEEVVIKQIPVIYNEFPSDELEYLMFILKAKIIEKNTLSVIDLERDNKISKDRIKGYKRAKKHELVIREEETFDAFWNQILIKNLKERHGVKPTHSLKEISFLKKYFSKEIRQFNVYKNDKIVAGTTIFESQNVAHSQYISADEDRSLLGSLDFLHFYIIDEVFKNEKKYFDFGNSNINNGENINQGLQSWKEGFGARTIIHNYYSIKTKNYSLLSKVLV